MSAEIESLSDGFGQKKRWLVLCAEHGLNRLVYSEQHATNLAQLHDRIDHAEAPEQTGGEAFDISAAAVAVLAETRTPGQGSALDGALAVWGALVGVPPDLMRNATDDLQNLLQIARDYADTPITAHTAPF